MTNRTEVTLAWIIVGIIAVPMCILHPGVLVAGILGYALWILYNHYKRQKRERADTFIFRLYLGYFQNIFSTLLPPCQVSIIFRLDTNHFVIQSIFRIHEQYFQNKMCVLYFQKNGNLPFSRDVLFLDSVSSLLVIFGGKGTQFIFSPNKGRYFQIYFQLFLELFLEKRLDFTFSFLIIYKN